MINKLFSITIIFTILLLLFTPITGFTNDSQGAGVRLAVCNNLDRIMYYRIERLDHKIKEYRGLWFPVAGGEIDGNTCNHDFSKYHARIYKVSWYNGYTITEVITVPDTCTKVTFYPDGVRCTYKENK